MNFAERQLEGDGLADDTIVIVSTGDGLRCAKRCVYDSGIQLPLIIHWPDGHYVGTRNVEMFSFVYITPTALSLTSTRGKSRGYRVDGSPWSVYTNTLPAHIGGTFEAKAIRYGFAGSPVAIFQIAGEN